MYRYFLLAFFLATSASNAAPSPDAPLPRREVSFDYLMEACSDIGDPAARYGDIPFFDCHSYIYGVLDTYLIASASIPKKSRACFPQGLAPWQVMRELLPLLSSNTNRGPAAPIIIATLRKKYPCK